MIASSFTVSILRSRLNKSEIHLHREKWTLRLTMLPQGGIGCLLLVLVISQWNAGPVGASASGDHVALAGALQAQALTGLSTRFEPPPPWKELEDPNFRVWEKSAKFDACEACCWTLDTIVQGKDILLPRVCNKIYKVQKHAYGWVRSAKRAIVGSHSRSDDLRSRLHYSVRKL